jgi:hypothetical protein
VLQVRTSGLPTLTFQESGYVARGANEFSHGVVVCLGLAFKGQQRGQGLQRGGQP